MPEPQGHALCVHGAGGGGWQWAPWARVFAANGWQPHAPDLHPAACGLSGTRLVDYVEQIRRRLLALPRPRVLVGASLGGLIGWLVAADADAIVLVNPLPPKPWQPDGPSEVDAVGGIVPWSSQGRFDGTRRALPEDPVAARHAFARWRDESAAVLRDACAGVVATPPAVPALVIGATGDTDIAPDRVAAFARGVGADWAAWPGLNHLQPLLGRDAPRVAAFAVDWLNARGLERLH